MSEKWDNNVEIQTFREYLKIPSIVDDDYDYVSCVTFLKKEASKLVLPVKVFYPGGPTKPIVIIEWKGTEPNLPKIALNSHMDVVPVNEEEWSQPPFAANIDFMGRIIARGSQDMKCNGMHYLAAIRALKKEKIRLKRTVLVMFMPDKENGGKFGMRPFVETDDFKELNIGFALDEGSCTQCDSFDVYYAERATWQLRFTITGRTGHASLLIKDTAGEKARYLIDKFMDYRTAELKRLDYQYTKLNIGDINSVNLTMMKGGVQDNVIPPEITLCFDCRLSKKVNHTEFEEQINQWMEEAGGGIELIFDQQDPYIKATTLENSPYWNAFQTAFEESNMTYKLLICPHSTDCRYLRQIGIPVIGFSALNHTPMLAHTHNEFLGADVYLKGIDIWKKIIETVANA